MTENNPNSGKTILSEEEKLRLREIKLRERERNDINKSKARKIRKWIVDFLLITVGCALYSFTVSCFTGPNHIAPGGVTGIATIVHRVFPAVTIGMFYGLANIPLVILGFIFIGREVMFKTLYSVALITVLTDHVFSGLWKYEAEQPLLAALFGGVLVGTALGMIYSCEGTSGGMDIVSRIIRRLHPHLSMGKIARTIDFTVVMSAILVFGNIESGLYTLILIFVESRVVDMILYGSLEGKLLLIFSDQYTIISERIMSEHKRGVTLLNGVGGFSGGEKKVICCAVQKNQYVKIKRTVKQHDPRAFIVVANAAEVLGDGFNENK